MKSSSRKVASKELTEWSRLVSGTGALVRRSGAEKRRELFPIGTSGWNECPTETHKIHRKQHQLITKKLPTVAHPLKQTALPCPAKGVMSTANLDWLFSVANDLLGQERDWGTRASLPSLYMHSLHVQFHSRPFFWSCHCHCCFSNSAPSVEASSTTIFLSLE